MRVHPSRVGSRQDARMSANGGLDTEARRSAQRAAAVAMVALALAACADSETVPEAADVPATGTPGPRTALGPEDAVRTVVVGDEGTGPPGLGDAWPDYLTAQLAAVGVPMTIASSATPGAGFSADPLFSATVEAESVGSTQLVILFDSTIGGADLASLPEAAEKTFTAVERASADARVLVVGPLPGDASQPEGPAEIVEALRSAAREAGAVYVDPVAEAWPANPSQEDIAGLLLPHVEPLALALAASGANR
jgi:hypothetical protein